MTQFTEPASKIAWSVYRKGILNGQPVNYKLNSGIVTLSSFAKTIISAKVPNWVQRIGRGEIINNYYLKLDGYHVEWVVPTSWSITCASKIYNANYTDTYFNYTNLLGTQRYPYPTSAVAKDPPKSKCINDAYAQLKTQGMAMVDAMESSKTLGMVRNNFDRILDVAKAVAHAKKEFSRLLFSPNFVRKSQRQLEVLRKRNKRLYGLSDHEIRVDLAWKRAGRYADSYGFRCQPLVSHYTSGRISRKRYRFMKSKGNSPESLWLEYHYGIMPTMMSIRDYTDEYIRSTTNRPRIRVRSKEDATVIRTKTYQSTFTHGTSEVPETFIYEFAQERKLTCTLIADVQFGTYYGASLSDLPSTTWELIPWSFVIDWFVNVGDTISALTPNPGVNLLMSCLATKRVDRKSYSRKFSAFSTGDPRDPTNTTSVEGAFAKRTEVLSYFKERVPNVTPIAELTWNFNFSSTTHLLSGIALAASRLRALRS